MYNQEKPEVAAAQKKMLEMLIAVHKICVAHKITYWLDAGTLLGAVRHKGFIPWDDDLDISMERDEYERFLNIAQQYLPEGMFLQTCKTDEDYPLPFAKIRMDGTELIETGETGEENYHHGIFIDIFPYDRYPGDWFVDWMRWGRLVRERKKKYRKGSLMRVLVTFYTNVVLLIPVEFTVKLRCFFEKHLDWFQNKEWNNCSFGLDCTDVDRTKASELLPTKLVEEVFEGETFYIPNNPDAVLKKEFGNDYMILPPPDKRKTHSQRIKV